MQYLWWTKKKRNYFIAYKKDLNLFSHFSLFTVLAALGGLLYIVGREMYFTGYIHESKKR